MQITQEQAAKLVADYSSSLIFSVTFVKRTTGELRIINCRKGVHKNLTGQGMRYDPSTKNLVTVWDLQKQAYRMVSLDSIQSIRMGGVEYRVV